LEAISENVPTVLVPPTGQLSFTLQQKKQYFSIVNQKGVLRTLLETGIHKSNLKQWRKFVDDYNTLVSFAFV
jgi:hypothetical protein